MPDFENVYGRFVAADGSPLSGSVVFTPAFSFARHDDTIVFPRPVVAELDGRGRVSASLLAPGGGVEPSTWGWEAQPRLKRSGASVNLAPFSFKLVKGQPVNLAGEVPAPDPVTGEYTSKGAPGVGIAAIESAGGELVIRLTDDSETRLPLPAGGAGGVSPEALVPLQEADRALGQRVAALESVEPVPGPAGPQGERGPAGPQGEPGPPGADGVSLEAAQELFASKADVDRRLSQIVVDTSPFKTGGRYYSPVTYYWPDYYNGEKSQWNKVLRFGENLGIVILNRNSGDWADFDQDFLTQAKLAKGAGAKRTIFYVKTQYGAAGNPAEWGQGVPNAEKFTKEYILQQLAYCKKHYADVFQGVFLDEFINGWGAHEERIPWYKELVDSIRSECGPDFTIVGNCGSNCNQGVLDLDVDVFMSYEYTAEKYLNPDPSTPIHPAHMAQYPGTRFWHVIHDVTPENYQQVFAKAEELGIGHLYITDGKLVMGEGGQWVPEVNPYAVAPSQWIADLLTPWLKGFLDTRLLAEKLSAQVKALEDQVADIIARNQA